MLAVHPMHMAGRRRGRPGKAATNPTFTPTFLRAWREHAELSLEEVADRIEISRWQLGRIEKGQQKYDQSVLEACAKVFGCTVEDLLTRKPTDDPTVFSVWSSLTEREKRQVIQVVRAIKGE